MDTSATSSKEPTNPGKGHAVKLGELAEHIRWRRYFLSRAASNPYLESPRYAE